MSKLDQFLNAVKRKGATIQPKAEGVADALTGKDIEAIAGAGNRVIKGTQPLSWSVPFPPPPGPINPWPKSIGPSPPPAPSTPVPSLPPA